MAAPFRIVGLQIAAVGAVCLLMSFGGFRQAGSALLGGAVIVLPNAIFAFGAARRLSLDGDDARLREARRLVGHGAFKWLLTAVLMAAAFALATIEPLGFFAALTVAIMAQMIAPVMPWVDSRASRKGQK
ncbi:MAG: ATP synthase subunit I [Gammaproteobacteria bacterium]|nr:ATP synthase subunit I [Gammaproteobacteria bacterium]MDE0225918.1 ATP synthase subunit I [Gammaproteobacteria bacterium]